MSAGRLSQRVELHRRDMGISATGSGEQVESWTLDSSAWAEVTPVGGNEAFSSLQRADSTTMRFRIRFREDVGPTWRIRWRGRFYDVVELLPSGQLLREWLDVAAVASPVENAEP